MTVRLSDRLTVTLRMDHKKRLSLALVLEGEDDDNPDYEYSLFNYKPRFCDMDSPLSSSGTKMERRGEFVTELKSRSTSYTSLSSDLVKELGKDCLTSHLK